MSEYLQSLKGNTDSNIVFGGNWQGVLVRIAFVAVVLFLVFLVLKRK